MGMYETKAGLFDLRILHVHVKLLSVSRSGSRQYSPKYVRLQPSDPCHESNFADHRCICASKSVDIGLIEMGAWQGGSRPFSQYFELLTCFSTSLDLPIQHPPISLR